ncbi:MAG: TIGR03936 family radical SAM-associated protein [Tissierellales bacterium]|jgi:radical SAM-linked protein|nr:TIGR03936 family radical SAM-associated protein [Tissierellales bacterium]
MSKLRLKFFKKEDMIYISHLDMMRVIQRAMKRAGMKVEYSQGFNPHPLMSFSTAVPLGLTIESEYMDIDMKDELTAQNYIDRINPYLPEGLRFIAGEIIDEKEKPIMGQIRWGSYLICIKEKIERPMMDVINDFMKREDISYTKVKKKKKKIVKREINIRPYIENIELVVEDSEFVVLKTLVRTGSEGNLKPDKMVELMNEVENLELDLISIEYQRLELFIEKDDKRVKPI